MRIPQTPPDLNQLFAQLPDPGRLAILLRLVPDATCKGRYLHWDELRYRNPPEGLTHQEWWLVLRIHRLAAARNIALKDTKGNAFQFSVPDLVTELLHQIDRGSGTLVEVPEVLTSSERRNRYVLRSLMEEAITSSQLEGAATTREIAKRMLADGRPPRDRSERMIVNNFKTMRRIMELKDRPLTTELVFEIHREISEGSLEVLDGAGRFRRESEAITVADDEGRVFHTPPPAAELHGRMKEMCAFANGETPGHFVHPVIRGILLHFWLAYDHPFVDGNGRTARALFYWHMLRSRYWLFEFISISQILRKSPVRYGTAFLLTETDSNDLTYFIIHQAEVITRALKELHEYAARKSEETRACVAALNHHPGLNHRQQALIFHALRHPGSVYHIAGHGTRHGVVYQTARADLLELAALKLLEQQKAGRAFIFVAPHDLADRVQKKRP